MRLIYIICRRHFTMPEVGIHKLYEFDMEQEDREIVGYSSLEEAKEQCEEIAYGKSFYHNWRCEWRANQFGDPTLYSQWEHYQNGEWVTQPEYTDSTIIAVEIDWE